MITLEPSKVRWLYDPTSAVHEYDDERLVEFLDSIRDCEINTTPSGRYHQLREAIHFWGDHHKFFFGVEHQHEAHELVQRWGGYCIPGRIVGNQFVSDL